MTALSNRYDFVLFFDVTNGNPNGDPDAGNLPRMDPETSQGLVSDVSIKRKIRNYVAEARAGREGHAIYVTENAILNDQHKKAYAAIRKEDDKIQKAKSLSPQNDAEAAELRAWMCANFFDIRTFGAVMSTGINCGQVRGPLQFTFGRSVEPIMPLEISITRMAATNEAEKKKRSEGADDDKRGDNRTMGRKHTVPYGVYVAHGFVSSFLAKQTGFGQDDLQLLWQALAQMFEHDRSAARGQMATRGLYVFVHDSELGNAPAHALFERLKVAPREAGQVARGFDAYSVTFDGQGLAAGDEVQAAPGVKLRRIC